jgi:hypothetical protein
MSFCRASFFAESASYLSDEQIEAAAIKWLAFLKSNTYTLDTASQPLKHRVFFAGENKKVLLSELDKEHPHWESQFTSAMITFLKQHRKDKFLSLHYDYEAKYLLEEFIASVTFLQGKRGIFPIKTIMTFDAENNIIVNGKAMSAIDIIDPPNEAKDVFDKLGCPRFLPAVKKIGKLLGR